MAKYKKNLMKIYAVRWNMDLLYSAANGNRGSSVSCQQRIRCGTVNSQTVLTAWDGERLVGLARVLDDSELVAFVHYVLVHPEYQGRKIAGNMVEYIRDKYKNYLYIEGMPEDSKNVAFYERHGFHVMEGGTPIQICNFSDKR